MSHSRVAVHFQQVPINQAKPPIFCCFFPFSISHSFGICSVFKGVSRRTYTITVEMDAALVRAGCCNQHRLGSFNNKHLLLTFLEAKRSKSKVPAYLVSGEGWFPGS